MSHSSYGPSDSIGSEMDAVGREPVENCVPPLVLGPPDSQVFRSVTAAAPIGRERAGYKCHELIAHGIAADEAKPLVEVHKWNQQPIRPRHDWPPQK
jgi:hypothetical protein